MHQLTYIAQLLILMYQFFHRAEPFATPSRPAIITYKPWDRRECVIGPFVSTVYTIPCHSIFLLSMNRKFVLTVISHIKRLATPLSLISIRISNLSRKVKIFDFISRIYFDVFFSPSPHPSRPVRAGTVIHFCAPERLSGIIYDGWQPLSERSERSGW